MIIVAIIGFITFIFSIAYLFYYVAAKRKDQERIFSKQIFYTPFISGLVLIVIGLFFTDTETKAQLETALAQNRELTSNLENLKSENAELNAQVSELESQIVEIEKEFKILEEESETLESEKESLNQQISELKAKNTSLENEVSSLESQLALAELTATASVNTNPSTVPSVSSGGREIFANCTELRTVYPKGVPSGHPAYHPSMDRDKDGYACER